MFCVTKVVRLRNIEIDIRHPREGTPRSPYAHSRLQVYPCLHFTKEVRGKYDEGGMCAGAVGRNLVETKVQLHCPHQ